MSGLVFSRDDTGNSRERLWLGTCRPLYLLGRGLVQLTLQAAGFVDPLFLTQSLVRHQTADFCLEGGELRTRRSHLENTVEGKMIALHTQTSGPSAETRWYNVALPFFSFTDLTEQVRRYLRGQGAVFTQQLVHFALHQRGGASELFVLLQHLAETHL